MLEMPHGVQWLTPTPGTRVVSGCVSSRSTRSPLQELQHGILLTGDVICISSPQTGSPDIEECLVYIFLVNIHIYVKKNSSQQLVPNPVATQQELYGVFGPKEDHQEGILSIFLSRIWAAFTVFYLPGFGPLNLVLFNKSTPKWQVAV